MDGMGPARLVAIPPFRANPPFTLSASTGAETREPVALHIATSQSEMAALNRNIPFHAMESGRSTITGILHKRKVTTGIKV
jgi:hypothetical protein